MTSPRTFRAPAAMLARKPAHGSPCNRCGLCCVATLCDLGNQVFRKTAGPCPALAFDGDQACCRLVSEAPTTRHRDAAMLLTYSGRGCDARFNGETNNADYTRRMNKEDKENRLAFINAWKLWGK